MEIFVTLLALAFLQVWGAKNPLHKDEWFFALRSKVFESNIGSNEIASFLSIIIPLILVAILSWGILNHSIWLLLPLSVVVLLYSFGRGEFFEIVREYTQACYVEDWASATARARRFHVDVDAVPQDDWSKLHRKVFEEAGYRGFERMFAVLFWFFVLGPMGALMYRLVFLSAKKHDSLAERWLWILEWPSVRVLGLSFALTGNFSGCMAHLNDCFTCLSRSTREALTPMILGALFVGEDITPDSDITRKELSLMSKLYQRTLWFWVFVVSVFVIIL